MPKQTTAMVIMRTGIMSIMKSAATPCRRSSLRRVSFNWNPATNEFIKMNLTSTMFVAVVLCLYNMLLGQG
jgi:hypothetical protein